MGKVVFYQTKDGFVWPDHKKSQLTNTSIEVSVILNTNKKKN